MIVLVRHGETEGNAKRILQVAETPLSDVGIAQAASLAPRILQLGAAAILCSDLLRARMTAEPIAALTGAPVTFSALLQERNFGDLRGTPYAALTSDPFAPNFAPPNGETWEMFFARVDQAFALIREHARALHGNLVVVTHGMLCAALVRRHVRVAAEVVVPDRFDNTSVTLFEHDAPYAASLVNCSTHLAGGTTREGAPV